MNDPRPSRLRWFLQLRLRTLLILMCILGAVLGLGGNFWRKLQQQRRAIAQVEGAGGQIIFVHDFGRYEEDDGPIEYRPTSFRKLGSGRHERRRSSPTGPVIDDDTPPGPAFLRYLLGENAFAIVDTIYFDDKNYSELQPKSLQAFSELRALRLSKHQLSNEWLQQAAQLPQLRAFSLSPDLNAAPEVNLSLLSRSLSLRHLGISGRWVSDETLRDVSHLRQLNSLAISLAPDVSSNILQELKELEHLQALTIIRAHKFDDAKANDFAALQQLRSLHLVDTSIGEPTLKAVGQLENLESLELTHHRLGDNELKHLADLQRLRHLNLWATDIGDEGVEALSALKELRLLSLRYTNITPATLTYISRKRELQSLDLSGLNLEDSEELLWQLRPLAKLRRLSVGPITPESVAVLQKVLPGCEIGATDKSGKQIAP